MRFLLFLFFGFILSFGALNAQAQSTDAEEYFHNSANSFIHSDLMNALNTVNKALQEHPDDNYLQQLKKLIEEELEKQNNQQNQDNNNQQDNQDQDSDSDSEQDQQENQQEQDNQDQNADEDQNQDDGNNNDKQTSDANPQPELQPGEMSREDAEKILNALAQKEKDLLKEFKKPQSKSENKNEKDW